MAVEPGNAGRQRGDDRVQHPAESGEEALIHSQAAQSITDPLGCRERVLAGDGGCPAEPGEGERLRRVELNVEGTGHAGVGAVIGLSNATVASLLGAPAVIVSEGGVGRPIDEIVLNAALFERHGVKVAGAIVNKVDLDAKPGLARTLERGLGRHGIPLLGVLPYRPILSNPTLAMVLEGVHGETIHPGPDLDSVIGGIAIGAMEPEHMLQRIGPRSLVIVPGDRIDVINAILGAHDAADVGGDGPLGIVLTGGYRPSESVLEAIRAADLFATLVPEDTYKVASELHDLLVKTHQSDAGKIAEIKALLWEYLFIDRVLEVAEEARLD